MVCTHGFKAGDKVKHCFYDDDIFIIDYINIDNSTAYISKLGTVLVANLTKVSEEDYCIAVLRKQGYIVAPPPEKRLFVINILDSETFGPYMAGIYNSVKQADDIANATTIKRLASVKVLEGTFAHS